MANPPDLDLTERDIQFDCTHCGNVLVVDRDGEGLMLDCPHCGKQVKVPAYRGDPRKLAAAARSTPPVQAEQPAAPAAAEVPARSTPPAEPAPPRKREFHFEAVDAETLRKRETELRQLLKENQSQRVEIQGYINQATIQLHRNQLKLRKLIERQQDFEAEMTALARHLGLAAGGGGAAVAPK